MNINSHDTNEINRLKRKLPLQAWVGILILLIIGTLTIFAMYLYKSEKSNNFTYTKEGFTIENLDKKYYKMQSVNTNILLEDFNSHYYVYNYDKGLDENRIYKDAIIVDIIEKNSVKQKGIIVTSNNEDWYLINNEGTAKQKIYSDLIIDHNVVSVDITGKFPIALKKLIIE
ncbi:MAG: hypothetical protein RR945_05685 [Erysipelotrichaceae bacterium]